MENKIPLSIHLSHSYSDCLNIGKVSSFVHL